MKSFSNMLFNEDRLKGLSLIELLTVILIIGILSTMAVNIYLDQVQRARIAAAKSEIEALELAATSYFIDLGQYPPSSTGTQISPNSLDQLVPFEGSGYLQVALMRSLSGNPYAPLESRWNGPYIEWDLNRMGTINGIVGINLTTANPLASINLLDPWGSPYYYVRSGRESTMNLPTDYIRLSATEYPSSSPFFAAETFLNPSSIQIISLGPNQTTLNHPEVGFDEDDITNFNAEIGQ